MYYYLIPFIMQLILKFIEEFKLIRSILFTYFFSDILYKISVFLIENVSLKRNESFLLNKIINNILTKMFFCAALVLLLIIKLRFPNGKSIDYCIIVSVYLIYLVKRLLSVFLDTYSSIFSVLCGSNNNSDAVALQQRSSVFDEISCVCGTSNCIYSVNSWRRVSNESSFERRNLAL